jgi:hypothetical protein
MRRWFVVVFSRSGFLYPRRVSCVSCSQIFEFGVHDEQILRVVAIHRGEEKTMNLLREYIREATATSPNSGGDCYEAAGRYMMDNCMVQPACGMKLVHAEVTGQGPIKGLKYGHAFVLDDRGTVIDRSNGRNVVMPKEVYYLLGQIGSNAHEYTWDEARQKMLEFEHWGPWDLSTESGH